MFWKAHDPCETPSSAQYQSLILTHNSTQEELVRGSLKAEKAKRDTEIKTQVAQFHSFTYAENHHQKFRLRRHKSLLEVLATIYPNGKELADSTVAMRINAFCGGCGTLKDLKSEIEQYDLPESAQDYLLQQIGPTLGPNTSGRKPRSLGGAID